MKEEIKKETKEHKVYRCDFCDYVSDRSVLTRSHEILEHNDLPTKEVAGHTLRYFDTEEEASRVADVVGQKRYQSRSAKQAHGQWPFSLNDNTVQTYITYDIMPAPDPDAGMTRAEVGKIEWTGPGWYKFVDSKSLDCCSAHWSLKVNAIPIANVIEGEKALVDDGYQRVANLLALEKNTP